MWVLILLVTIGGLSDRESNAMATVPGFTSQEACSQAGKQATRDLEHGKKNVRYSCVQQK